MKWHTVGRILCAGIYNIFARILAYFCQMKLIVKCDSDAWTNADLTNIRHTVKFPQGK